MSYTNNSYEVQLTHQSVTSFPTSPLLAGMIADVTGLQGEWGPGIVPHQIHAAAIGIQHTNTAAVEVRIFKSVVAGSVQATDRTNLGQLHAPAAIGAGKVVYWYPTVNVNVEPGETIQFAVTTAATGGATVRGVLMVSPTHEHANHRASAMDASGFSKNLTNMYLTTGTT